MLGIGFIITHFVAMEKPQQRKYHSSCNRSVHRGTAHGKQEVKVCKRKTPHLLVRSFLSPYGDGTGTLDTWHYADKFSPPYGDGILTLASWVLYTEFSPSYGDCTRMFNVTARKTKFSPPYGDGTRPMPIYSVPGMFSPPYGDGTDTRYQFKWNSEVFAPLRGWYSRVQKSQRPH